MKHFVFFLSAVLFGFGQAAAAVKPCEELRAEIAAKLDSKGVKGYELAIATDAGEAGKVVGRCEDGSKKIVYFKPGAKPAQNQVVALPEKLGQDRPQVTVALPVPQGDEKPVPVVAVKMIQVESDLTIKSCEELKTEIAGKLAAKGVKNYELTVAARGKAAGKVVGSCENGSKQIVYSKK